MLPAVHEGEYPPAYPFSLSSFYVISGTFRLNDVRGIEEEIEKKGRFLFLLQRLIYILLMFVQFVISPL
jgi:hypothetical protein